MDSFGTTPALTHKALSRIPVSPTRQRVFIAGLVLLGASVTLNVVLAHKVRSLLRPRSLEGSARLLEIGESVPPITARKVDGEIETISYSKSDRPTVLYVFTPACSWCARNLENIKTLRRLRGAEYRFIGLSLSREGVSSNLAVHGFDLSTYTDLSKDALEAYKLHGTPQTIVISPEGRVIQNWMGAYVGHQKSQIEAFFHVSLPGIRPLQNDH